jgi:cobalt-zinc-cadmium efflux system membrane fusion protein
MIPHSLKSRIFIALCTAFCIGLAGCGGKQTSEAETAPKSTETVTRGNQVTVPADSPMLNQIHTKVVESAEVPTEEVDAPGQIEADPNRLSHVVLPLAGRVSSVLVHLGDSVQRGQVLLLVESPDADAAMSAYTQAQAGVDSAKSVLLRAQADYERSKDLFQNNAAAQKDVLANESALAQAKASLETAKAVREQAQRKLDLLGLKSNQFGQQIEVKAPISGKVLEISVAPNEYRNDTNASLMMIADLSQVWVSSDVPETKIRFIERGEEIDLELEAWPGRIFHARVKQIADTVDPTTRTVKVHAELANANGQLRPEMFGRIRHVESMKTLPVIPVTAVVQGDGQNAVYRETGNGTFDRVPVELGISLGDRVAVTKGIKAGDRVVTDGVMLLKGQ